MTAELIISVSGLRGIVGESLTPLVAMRYAAAFATELPPGPLLITRDGRATGAMLSSAIAAALVASGREVIEAGVAATPTTGVLVRAHGCVGGIQISASHNPPQYNGMKLFNAEGRVIPAAPGQRVADAYHGNAAHWATHAHLGTTHLLSDTTTKHLQLVLNRVDADKIRARKFRVLLDANHGAGSLLGIPLLNALGCEVICLGATPDGQFAHPPEPTAENLRTVLNSVREQRCDVGFCQDPDADRLALIDEQGQYVGEEYTLALCVDHILPATPGPIVTNCASSRMTLDLAAKHRVPFYRSAVGEANVVDEMRSRGAVFGGEGNGGPIDPQIGFVRDSFIGMALVLEGLATRGEPLSAWAGSFPRYDIVKDKVALARPQVAAAMQALRETFADAEASDLDGLRLDWSRSWLIVRASNTEPIVRIIAEAPTAAEARELCDRAMRVLAQA